MPVLIAGLTKQALLSCVEWTNSMQMVTITQTVAGSTTTFSSRLSTLTAAPANNHHLAKTGYPLRSRFYKRLLLFRAFRAKQLNPLNPKLGWIPAKWQEFRAFREFGLSRAAAAEIRAKV